jgi:zinc transport system ATP-binding protein
VAVDNISFDVKAGDLLGIVGPNGSGKTTLFRAIFELQPYSGTISLFGYGRDKFQSLLPLVGYVPQKIAFEPNFPATVHDVVSMGIIPEKRTARGEKLILNHGYQWNHTYRNIDKMDSRVKEVLKTVKIEHLGNRRIGELSGGEQQRVFIATSLINDPLILVLDEPVTSVDVESQTRFYDVVTEINRNGTTIVWSSHDLDALEKYASKVACMNRKLFFHGHKEDFFANEDILKTYTESTMQAHMHGHGHAH